MLVKTVFIIGFVLSVLLDAKQSVAQGAGADMMNAANEFLASLDGAQLPVAKLPFSDPNRMDWHNIPKQTRKGLQYRDMSPNQRELCRGLLKVALSESGFEQVMNIMALEINIREGEIDSPSVHLRDPERFYLTIFGDPDIQGLWGWRFEGHHLSLNFVIRDGQVISCTPHFFGSNPAIVSIFVPGGPPVGTRNLADEEQLGFDLLHALDSDQLKVALIDETAPADYRYAGEPEVPTSAAEGLSGERMSEVQLKQLAALIEVYCNHLTPELAKWKFQAIMKEGIENIHFVWAGATEPGSGHYYRIQGPTVLIEFINNQADPEGNPANHIHSIWRDPKNDFGRLFLLKE